MNKLSRLFGALLICLFYARESNAECPDNVEPVTTYLIESQSNFYGSCCSDEEMANMKWLDGNNKELISDTHIYTERKINGIDLYIIRLRITESPYHYKCIIENGGKTITFEHIIEVYEKPTFINTPENQNIINGSDSLVFCVVAPVGDPNIRKNWYREKFNTTEIVDDEKYTIVPNGLLIANITSSDEGIYICRASHINGGDYISRKISVEVMTLPTIYDMIVTPNDTLNVGGSLTIQCMAQGMPLPEFTWGKLLKTKYETNFSSWIQIGNSITLQNVTADDRGLYECIAFNEAGSTKRQVFVEVLTSPMITEFKNLTVMESSIAQIICKAEGRPAPDIEVVINKMELMDDIVWSVNRSNISDTEAINVVTFTNTSRELHGMYFCKARNDVGEATERAFLSVEHRPYITEPSLSVVWTSYGKELNISCENESNPPATIEWNFFGNDSLTDNVNLINEVQKKLAKYGSYVDYNITQDSDFGIYGCKATNKHGTDTKYFNVTKILLPGPIMNVIIHEIKPTLVVFNITGPLMSRITGYMAEYDKLENYNITNIHLNRTWAVERPYRINNLKPNTTYNVRFAVKNEVGDGKWSNYMEFRTPESTVPDSPIWEQNEDTVLQYLSNTKTLVWQEPENNGEPIDFYLIRYCLNESLESAIEEVCKEQRSTTNKISLEGLESNKTYNFEIQAHNLIGYSATKSALITLPDFSSTEPTSLLSAGAIIAISVITVFVCLLVLDVILLVWQRKGIIASCFKKKNKKKDNFSSRDNKGLLKENTDSAEDTLKRPESKERKPEYKHTGVITGKHSAV